MLAKLPLITLLAFALPSLAAPTTTPDTTPTWSIQELQNTCCTSCLDFAATACLTRCQKSKPSAYCTKDCFQASSVCPTVCKSCPKNKPTPKPDNLESFPTVNKHKPAPGNVETFPDIKDKTQP